jgi:molybdopterin synthase sulfur carrier subunit
MKVKFYATLREIVGGKEVDIPLDGVVIAQELLDKIIELYPALRKELLDDEGNLHGHVHFFINGRDIQFHEEAWGKRIMPEDGITIFPAIGGG